MECDLAIDVRTVSFKNFPPIARIFSLSQAGVAWAQGNTSLATDALQNNTTGSYNTASGSQAFFSNTTGTYNTASGEFFMCFLSTS
jgi:hypothetical protein